LFFTGAANRTFRECHLNIASAQNLCENYITAEFSLNVNLQWFYSTDKKYQRILRCCLKSYVAYCIPWGRLNTKRLTIVFFLGPTDHHMRREIIPVRGQSYVFRLPKCWPPPPHPPLRPGSVYPPLCCGGRTDSLGGEGDGGGSTFWKTRDIGLPSDSNNLSTIIWIDKPAPAIQCLRWLTRERWQVEPNHCRGGWGEKGFTTENKIHWSRCCMRANTSVQCLNLHNSRVLYKGPDIYYNLIFG
jgi:hypothetical protein